MSGNKKSSEPASAPRLRPADFRTAISQAELDGVSKDAMVLRLTLNDAAHLKRDRAIPVEDISFAGGDMRFMGVKTIQGGVAISVLERVAADGAPGAALT